MVDPADEGISESGRVGLACQVGDVVVVLQFMNQDRDGPAEDLGDETAGVQLTGRAKVQAGEVVLDLVCRGIGFGAAVLVGVPQAAGPDPRPGEFGADGIPVSSSRTASSFCSQYA